jgi:cob(I)alamin adenosyltransferase
MKIYTGTGDQGRTGLLSGHRVAKDHPRVRAVGDLDELSSWLGMVTAWLGPAEADIRREIERIQGDLLDSGAWISSSGEPAVRNRLRSPGEEPARFLEQAMDRMDQGLEPLRSFILAGGTPSAAAAHGARTVARRAERSVVTALSSDGTGGSDGAGMDSGEAAVLVFLNRLSDYLFVLARHLNQRAGRADVSWKA